MSSIANMQVCFKKIIVTGFWLVCSVMSFSTLPAYADPACGDGIVEGMEQCDDNNMMSSDGCSSVCIIEANWSCAGSPSVCEFTSPCTAGNYWNGTACTGATAGHYVPDAAATEQKACAMGSYQPGTQSTSCIFADANYYVDLPAATAQTPCQGGTISNPGASSCGLPAYAYFSDFVQGQPAVADDMNDRFTSLVDKVNQLQAQLNALQSYAGQPTTASLVGTYNLTELNAQAASGGAGAYNMQSESGLGTITLNADGTGSVNSTNRSTQLFFSTAPMTVLTNLNVSTNPCIDSVTPSYANVQGSGQLFVDAIYTHSIACVTSAIQSTQNTTNINVSANSNTNPDSGTFTWSHTGNTVTINADGPLTYTVAGRILVGASSDELGNPGGISILVRQ